MTRDLMARIAAIATAHHLLSTAPDARTIALDDYFVTLTKSLSDLWAADTRGIRVTSFCTTRMVRAEAAIHLGMAISELVTNAFKNAFGAGRQGDIRVGFSVAEGQFILLVGDDGSGLAPADPGHSGMGQRLLSGIAARFGGTFSYQPGRPGTIAMLTGPAEMLL